MNPNKRNILLVTAVILCLCLLLSACGGGGGGGGGVPDGLGDSCQHLNCLPEANAMDKIKATLEDAEYGIIDEGESELGDALIRAAELINGE